MSLYGMDTYFYDTMNPNYCIVEKSILRRSQILALSSPRSGTLRAFRNWFRNRKPFSGSSFHLLDDENDLIALRDEPDYDRLSAFIHKYFGYILRKPNEAMPKSWEGMYYYPKERVALVVATLSVLISAILLFGAIVVLYFVPPKNMWKRLIVVGCFTTAFAASVGVLKNAKRVEIFAATAAYVPSDLFFPRLLIEPRYTAVLVVFLTATTE